jgi:hypothetical protein
MSKRIVHNWKIISKNAKKEDAKKDDKKEII